MTQIQVKIIKFTNKEQIVATIDSENYIIDGTLIVAKPIEIDSEQYWEDDNLIESMIMKPWMPLSDDKLYFIHMSNVLCIANADDKTIKKYSEFLKAYQNTQKKVNQESIHETVANRTLH